MQPYAKVDIYLKKLYNLYFKQSDSISTFYIICSQVWVENLLRLCTCTLLLCKF